MTIALFKNEIANGSDPRIAAFAKNTLPTIDDETLEAKVTVLKELVEHHVEEEESTIFDEARTVFGNKLQALGEENAALQRARRSR
jgi:hypothetical protein